MMAAVVVVMLGIKVQGFGLMMRINVAVMLMVNPDHRTDLKNRSPHLGPYTTKGHFQGTLLGDLFFRSIRWSGKVMMRMAHINERNRAVRKHAALHYSNPKH